MTTEIKPSTKTKKASSKKTAAIVKAEPIASPKKRGEFAQFCVDTTKVVITVAAVIGVVGLMGKLFEMEE